MDRFIIRAKDVNGTKGDANAPAPLVAVLAACLAALEREGRPAPPRGMPAWKRAALAELMGPGTRDFI